MQTRPFTRDDLRSALPALRQSELLRTVDKEQLAYLLNNTKVVELGTGETLAEEGDDADAYFLVIAGSIDVVVEVGNEAMTVARLRPGDTMGELGLLLNEKRNAALRARERSMVLRIESDRFDALLSEVPQFGRALARQLAARLRTASRSASLNVPSAAQDLDVQDEALGLLPPDFCRKHRLIAVRVDDGELTVGAVDGPDGKLLHAVRHRLPALTPRFVQIPVSRFEDLLDRAARVGTDEQGLETAGPDAMQRAIEGGDVDAIFKGMVKEGASDLHLSGGQVPCWRIDGDIRAIPGCKKLGRTSVTDLMRPALDDSFLNEFDETGDVDLAHAVDGAGRFRINLFRDHRGDCMVARHIPDKLLTIEQLGLPASVKRLCEKKTGLVVVTGPTGSGKSTTLAAMVDWINRTRQAHILTLEDPIEFVHDSKKCLVNQRDIGNHSATFSRALKAALREDPDIVLIGEMRDLETVALAMETANTGHLVFGTLHTSTAISTIDRIIDSFPHEQQQQVRAGLGDALKGVVAQTLCRRVGGGRVAAVEVLVVTHAVSNLIGSGKTGQIGNQMQTGRSLGMTMLNHELQRLVQAGTITPDEAISRAADKADMAQKLKVELPEN